MPANRFCRSMAVQLTRWKKMVFFFFLIYMYGAKEKRVKLNTETNNVAVFSFCYVLCSVQCVVSLGVSAFFIFLIFLFVYFFLCVCFYSAACETLTK